MIKNISLPELHTTGNLVDKDDYNQFLKSKKEPWSIKKALETNQIFNIVSGLQILDDKYRF